MRLLLDTHVAIWALTNPSRLSPVGRELIGESGNEVYVSVASIWEISIKRALKRASAPRLSSAETVHYLTEVGYTLVDVTTAHAVAIETLPSIHNDPFDRIIIAQALSEPMRLLTHDRIVAAYGDTIVLV